MLFRNALFAVVALLLAQAATAWGPATHAYVVRRALREPTPQAVYGAILPDIHVFLLKVPGATPAIKHLTHYEFDRIGASPLRDGFLTHNGVWGADYDAHLYLYDAASGNYAAGRIRALAAVCSISTHEAEDYFETAVDIIVASSGGPEFAQCLIDAADSVGEPEESAFVAAFAAPLAEKMLGLEPERAETLLRWAFRAQRTILRAYGQGIARGRNVMVTTAASLLAKQMECDTKTAQHHLDEALAAAKDCLPELDAIAARIRTRLERP